MESKRWLVRIAKIVSIKIYTYSDLYFYFQEAFYSMCFFSALFRQGKEKEKWKEIRSSKKLSNLFEDIVLFIWL